MTDMITIDPTNISHSVLSVNTKVKQFNNFTTAQMVLYEVIKNTSLGNKQDLNVNEMHNYFISSLQQKENVYLNEAIKNMFNSNEQFKKKLLETYIDTENSDIYSQYNRLLVDFKYKQQKQEIEPKSTVNVQTLQNRILPIFISYEGGKLNMNSLSYREKAVLIDRLITLYGKRSLPSKLLNIIDRMSRSTLPKELQITYEPTEQLKIKGKDYTSILDYVQKQLREQYYTISNLLSSSLIGFIKTRVKIDQTFTVNLLETENKSLVSYNPNDILETLNTEILCKFRVLLKERLGQQLDVNLSVQTCKNIMFVLSSLKEYLDIQNKKYIMNDMFVKYLLNSIFRNIDLSLYIIPDTVPENINTIVLSYKGFEKVDTSIIWSYVKHVSVMNSKYGSEEVSIDCNEGCIRRSIENMGTIFNNIRKYSDNQGKLSIQDNIKKGKVKIYTRENCVYCTNAKNILVNRGYLYEEIKVEDENTESVKESLKDKTDSYDYYPIIFVDNVFLGGYKELKEYVDMKPYKESRSNININSLSQEDLKSIVSILTNNTIKSSMSIKQSIKYLQNNITTNSVKQRIYNYSTYK
jgi:glutaredoxin 3